MAKSQSKDSNLGKKIKQHLLSLGIETPIANIHLDSKKVQFQEIENNVHNILVTLGLNLEDDSLRDTPKRVAKMFMNEIFYGLDYSHFPTMTTVENKMMYDEMIMERGIKVSSTCEHHILPIVGVAHVAYIPDKKVLGLSKLNRVVDFFSRRPQIQERLTEQIYAALSYVLETENIAIIIEAEHMCVKTRGVEDPCSDTVTSKLGGVFKTASVRQEFMSLAFAKA